MRRNCTVLGLAVVAALLPFVASGAEPKVRIAVLEFTEKGAGGWSGHVGQAAEEWFVDALVNTKKFSVFERQQLEALLAEKSFQMSGQVDQSTALGAGKAVGAQVVVFGNIDFAQKDQQVHSSGGFGGLLNKLPWGSGGRKVSEGNLTARAVNVQTGEIIFSQSETVSASNWSLDIMGTGGGTNWDETVVRKTFQPAVEKITAELATKIDQLRDNLGAVATGAEGKVVLLKDGMVYLNLGKIDGVKPGDAYEVLRAEIIYDPDTKQELGRDEKLLGRVAIEKITGDHLSVAKVVSGGEFEKGDLVKRK